MKPKYLQIGLLGFSIFATGAAFAGATKVVVAEAPQAQATMLPPPPPVMDAEFQKQLKKAPDSADKKARIDIQKQIDNALTPQTPEQMRRTQEKAVEAEKIRNWRNEPRKPRDRDVFWSVGSVGETIRMAPGYTTTVLFFNAQGNPVQVAPPGAIVGDQDAIEPNTSGNAVVLYVKQPWKSTNLTVFLQNIPVPVQFTLTSDRDAGNIDVDYQVRTRVMDGASASMERKDTYNMNALLQLTNGMSGGPLVLLNVISVEQGDPSKSLNWTPIQNNIAQMRVGPDGYTYVILKPGFKLVYPNVPNVLAALTGADGTQGYIVGGNNPRVFTAQDNNGAMYRITVQR